MLAAKSSLPCTTMPQARTVNGCRGVLSFGNHRAGSWVQASGLVFGVKMLGLCCRALVFARLRARGECENKVAILHRL